MNNREFIVIACLALVLNIYILGSDSGKLHCSLSCKTIDSLVFQLPDKMPNKAKTHDDCRKTVCFLCMRKCSRQVTSFIEGRVQTILATEIDFTDSRVSQGICEPCRVTFRKKSDGECHPSFPFQVQHNHTKARHKRHKL